MVLYQNTKILQQESASCDNEIRANYLQKIILTFAYLSHIIVQIFQVIKLINQLLVFF